jgi:hypothetical protein
MRIKIIAGNAALEAALTAANGKATTHTFTALEVLYLAKSAESRLAALGLAKRARKGAMLKALSGAALPGSYKYRAIRTHVTIERGASCWFLTGVFAKDYAGQERPFRNLYLTPEQDCEAVTLFRKQYGVRNV